MYFDGDDDDDTTDKPKEEDYNVGDDIGERIGEGHDPVEDSVL
jgi:hypothetical protein